MLHSLWLPRGCINSKHCMPLCATGLEVGDSSVEKFLFSKTILSHSTTPFIGYFLCIPVAWFPMREHLSRVSKVYQTTKANFIPKEKLPIFKHVSSLVRFLLFGQLLSWPLCCNHVGNILCLFTVRAETCCLWGNMQLSHTQWRPHTNLHWERRTCPPLHYSNTQGRVHWCNKCALRINRSAYLPKY